ncbi:MAG: hypothetical protein EBZ58_12490 [Bacteroidetes bacterium]|nr:hypothetical protein [Bacteroidota bacterium]
MSSNETINDTTNTWTLVTKKSYVPKPKQSCRFGVGCKKGGDACDFEHPTCRNGATCPKKGNGCAFRHPKSNTPAKAVATPVVVGSVFQQMATLGDDDESVVENKTVLKSTSQSLKDSSVPLTVSKELKKRTTNESKPIVVENKTPVKETWASRLNKPVPVVPPAPQKSEKSDDMKSIQHESTSSVSKKLDLDV